MNAPRLHAITRAVSARLADCELTYRSREPIDIERARAQHDAYIAALERLGATVERLPADDALPDSVFVEDAAVVLDTVAIITRPGAASRRAETAAVADALRPHRPLRSIEAPATLDGGDVLVIGRTIYVGRSTRTDAGGSRQLETIAAPFGYRVVDVPLDDCLHLKSACTHLGGDAIILNPDWVDGRIFAGLERFTSPPDEPWGASVRELAGTLLVPDAYPRTATLLADAGYRVEPVALGEFLKAEGGPTCLSIVFDSPPRTPRTPSTA
jgi:dimethylargininase